jgi:tripartite-type tricarboxylate transporter receptor subunit TctC
MAIIDPPPTTAQVQAGKLRALAVTGAKRTRELPDVPTMAEAGVSDVVVGLWSGFFVPAGTPKPIIDKLARELKEVILNSAARDQLIGMAVNPGGNTPEEFRALIANEVEMWRTVVQDGKLTFSE